MSLSLLEHRTINSIHNTIGWDLFGNILSYPLSEYGMYMRYTTWGTFIQISITLYEYECTM
jgi:hypothetical protein